ncbi:hypothetical protein J6590_038947 [Homalodisca vitripennis]|nr:hypothetical protein J6590_090358 [Homalodisca vitripennis]KAG8292470.1 hypothetical protein J6590_038947 [Homalodisca vitripennis]
MPDSALLRSALGTSGFRCWEYGGRAPENWGRGSVLEGIPVPDFYGPLLPHDALVNLKNGISRTQRQRYGGVGGGITPSPFANCRPVWPRLPVHQKETDTPVVSDEFRSEKTPVRSQEMSFPLVSPKGKNMEYAAETIFTEVKKMKDVLLDMRAATSRQKNLSTAVSNGMISLESFLDLIDSFRQAWMISMERLQRESREKETQVPSPSMVAAASTTAGKPTAGSPPKQPREEKRQRDAGDHAYVDVTEESELRQVVSKKKKRKVKAVDKSGKRQDLPPPSPPQVKKTEKLPRSRPRKQVVLVKPKADKSYAEILDTLRAGVTPEESGIVVCHIRKTRRRYKRRSVTVVIFAPLFLRQG